MGRNTSGKTQPTLQGAKDFRNGVIKFIKRRQNLLSLSASIIPSPGIDPNKNDIKNRQGKAQKLISPQILRFSDQVLEDEKNNDENCDSYRELMEGGYQFQS